ncbi:hypothetical protein DMP17_44435 [Pseudonocardia sp. TMWB2A]|uniref:AfsR/SARP family transcriptional regulator n=1 Tax=Pseudonocardia sp. TMWB2A TaxID=687430 RepID=UPI00307DA6FC
MTPLAAIDRSSRDTPHAIRVLGPLEVHDGDRLLEIAGVRRQAVLVLLVLNEGRAVPLDRIISRLWPDRPPPTAAAAVRNNISALRRLLQPLDAATIETVGSTYALRLRPGALDVTTAREQVARGMRLLDRGEVGAAGRELTGALTLWRGGLLPSLGQAGYRWSEVAELEELRIRAWEGVAEVDLRRGRHRECVPRLQRLVRQFPDREGFHRQRIVALAGAGRPADAVSAFHEARSAAHRSGRPLGTGLISAYHDVLGRDASGVDGASRSGRGPRTVVAGDGGGAVPRTVTVLCVRFPTVAHDLVPKPDDSVRITGAAVTRRADGVTVAVFGPGGDQAGGTDLALENALAIRRRSRAAGLPPPTVVVATGPASATDTAQPGTDLTTEFVEQCVRLARAGDPGALRVL